MSALFEGHDEVATTIAAIRTDFEAALAGRGEGEGANGLTVDGIELRVDQVRGVANTPGGAHNWAERDGRLLMRNDDVAGRVFLSYVVGAERYFSAADFEHILARVCAAERSVMRESDVAQFVNMVVAEPLHDARSELAVWGAVAVKLGAGRPRERFPAEIPELVTSFDPLHAEIPAGADFADVLKPEAFHPLEPTLEAYTARLAAEAGEPLDEHVRRHVLAPAGEARS
jgi:hypothetical protein